MSKNILVVEDEIALLKAIENKLSLFGFNVFAVTDVQSAFAVLKKTKIDLIWLDHYLPGKNGLEFFVQIKHDEDYKNIPVYLVSNSADVEDVYSYVNLGLNKYYVKLDSGIENIVSDIDSFLNKAE